MLNILTDLKSTPVFALRPTSADLSESQLTTARYGLCKKSGAPLRLSEIPNRYQEKNYLYCVVHYFLRKEEFMDCLRRIFCCSSGGEFDETMELTAHKKESTVIGTHPVTETIAFLDTKLPKINVTNVTASFAAKLAQCKTTPVPLLGTYNIPFPGTKLVHIIQDTDSTLNIISVQHRPGSGFSGSDACINLHHVFFPNYINENDPGEGKIFSVDIRDIKVNGEEKSNIYGQKVWVHDGRFSPRLTNLIDQMEVGPVVVSTIISLPRLSRDHLYHDVSKIKMLNVILSGEISENIKDYMTIDDLENQLDPDTYLRIRNFTDGVEHY